MGLTYSSQFPLIASYGSKYSKAPSGTAFSLLVGAGGAGSMIIPYIMGVIGESLDLKFAMYVPAVFLLLVGLIFITFRYNENTSKLSKGN